MNGCSGDMTFCSAASDAVALEEICKITGCGEAGCAVPATCGSGGFVDCGPLGACCLGHGRCNLLNANGCAVLDGEYQGDDTSCDQIDCPRPPIMAPAITWQVAVLLAGILVFGGMYVLRRGMKRIV